MRQPLLDGAGADGVVHGVEAVVVREEVDPQPQAGRREQDLLPRALAAQERRIVPGDGLGQDVRRKPGRIQPTLLLPHRHRIELREFGAQPKARWAAAVAPLENSTATHPSQDPLDGHAGAGGLEPRARDDLVGGAPLPRCRRQPDRAEHREHETIDVFIEEGAGADERAREGRADPRGQDLGQLPGHLVGFGDS